MPISRRKSCLACRAAKTRCSLAEPCERCSFRAIACCYANTNAAQTPTRARRRLVARETSSTGEEATPRGPRTVDSFLDGLLDVQSAVLNTSTGVSSLGLDFDLLPNMDSFMPALSPDSLFGTGNWLASPKVNTIPLATLPAADMSFSSLSPNQTSVSSRSDLQSYMTRKVLIGQLLAYPQRMLTINLPPFIFPSCLSTGECARLQTHICLPTKLAVCRVIVTMCVASIDATGGFIMSTILDEVTKICQEVSSRYV